MCKENKDIYKELQESPMFQLSLASKELFHSNFLAWIGSWDFGNKKKRGKDHPFRQLMSALGASHALDDSIWGDQWYVAREYRNFDLCVLNRMPDEFQEDDGQIDNSQQEDSGQDDGIRVLLVLENKVKSIPNIEQLQEYQDKVLDINFTIAKGSDTGLLYKWQLSDKKGSDEDEKKRQKKYKYSDKKKYASGMRKKALANLKQHIDFLLLSMSDDFPERDSIETEGIWQRINYSKYLSALENLSAKRLNKSILNDYCKQLGLLLSLHKEWTEDDGFWGKEFLYFVKKDNKRSSYRFDYLRLKELRIHDLFQKQRYAKMCLALQKRINEKVIKERHGLTCVNRMNVAEGGMQNKVNIGFNYLHGEPLLDIWLGTDKYAYTIQVQGDSYEHGIQQMIKTAEVKNKGENSKSLWDSIWKEGGIKDSVTDWNWICPFSGDPFNGDGEIQQKKEQKEYFPVVPGYTIFDNNDQGVYPDFPSKWKGKSFPFLKYELDNGVTFIYQYRKISDRATVNEVLDYIVADFEALCNMILGKP